MDDVVNIRNLNQPEQEQRFREDFTRRFEGETEPTLTHCPNHDDSNPSCEISLGEIPGTLHLHCMTPNCNDRQVHDAAVRLGIDPRQLSNRKRREKTADIISPVPQAHAERFPYKTGEQTTVWVKVGVNDDGSDHKEEFDAVATVYDFERADGGLSYKVVRLDYTDHEGRPDKLVRSIVFANTEEGQKWVWGWPDPSVKREVINRRRLESIGTAKPVAVVEGEATWKATTDPNHHWAGGLSQFEWTTYSSGADNFLLSDWSWAEGRDMYLVPDNDNAGCKAFRNLAILLLNIGAKSVHMLDFGLLDFPAPHKWDLANPVWKREHGGYRRKRSAKVEAPEVSWVEFANCFVPVDRPFREIWTQDMEGNPELTHEIRSEFVQQWVHLRDEDVLVYRGRPTIKFSQPKFNNAMAQQYAPRQVWSYVIDHPDLESADRLGFRPGETTGKLFRERTNGDRCLNSWRPPELVAEKGSIRPFLHYMRHLIPDRKERKTLIRWLAMIVGMPQERRLEWAVLLVSETHGVGKTILMTLTGYIVGMHNTHNLSPDVFMKDPYNDFLEDTYLVLIEELREGPAFQLPEKLKELISNDQGQIRRMYSKGKTCEYHSVFMASSNHKGSANVSNKDRRWFMPAVTNNDTITDPYLVALANGRSVFEWFVNWAYYGGGAQALLWYAIEYSHEHYFAIGTASGDKRGLSVKSPMTATKQEMLAAAKPEWFQDLLDVLRQLPDGAVVTLEDMKHWLKHQCDNPSFKRATLIKLLADEGWVCPWPKNDGTTENAQRGRLQYHINDGKGGKRQVSQTVFSRSKYWYNDKEAPAGYKSSILLRQATWWLLDRGTGVSNEKLFADGRWFEDEGGEPDDDGFAEYPM